MAVGNTLWGRDSSINNFLRSYFRSLFHRSPVHFYLCTFLLLFQQQKSSVIEIRVSIYQSWANFSIIQPVGTHLTQDWHKTIIPIRNLESLIWFGLFEFRLKTIYVTALSPSYFKKYYSLQECSELNQTIIILFLSQRFSLKTETHGMTFGSRHRLAQSV